MALDDFFTLTEMNNGLTAPSRVRELMDVLQNKRTCIGKSDADLLRQWSAVARAVSATENKDCLDTFVQMDGLKFISKWLEDAQKFSNNSVDSFVEESIAYLLQALETLIVDHENLFDFEIWTTIQNLLVYDSLKVQAKAQVLFDRRTKKGDGDACVPDVEKSRTSVNDEAVKSSETSKEIESSKSSFGDATIFKENSGKGKRHELTRDGLVLSSNSGTVGVEGTDRSEETLDCPIGDGRPLDHVGSSSLGKSNVELSHFTGAASEPCNPAVSVIVTVSTLLKPHGSESACCIKQSPKVEDLPDKVQSTEEFNTIEDEPVGSLSDLVGEMKPVPVVCSDINSLARDRSLCGEEGLLISPSRRIDLGGKGTDDNGDVSKFSSSSTFIATEPEQADKKSDMLIGYGIIEPQEVTRQVALEVEREVVDSTEHSCSSSDKPPEDNLRSPSSPGSAGGKILSHSGVEFPNTLSEDSNLSDESSPIQQVSAISSENLEDEQVNDTQEMVISQAMDVAQDKANMEKRALDFDLNQEFFPEDAHLPGNIFSTPISIAYASRAAPAPGLPCVPLQFKGNLGWKGSAATSAFHSASPQQMPEINMHPSTLGSSTVSNLRQGYLNIDLNAAESVVTGPADTPPDKQAQVFSTLPSEESSVEMNSRRPEHLELDLNCASDGGSPPDLLTRQFFHQGNCSHSYCSQNIDLNDQPLLPNDSSYNHSFSMPSQSFNASGGVNSESSEIYIMGTRVQVNQRNFVSQYPPLPNGRAPEAAYDTNLGMTRSPFPIGYAVPVPHSSVYGYNNISHAPTIPFSATHGAGGPIPYMVDSRGAPVIPRPISPATALSHPPPFMVNMNSLTPPTWIVPLQSGFNLDSGMFPEQGSSMNSTQDTLVNNQLRLTSQPSGLAVGGKRKEPENGFGHYPFEHFMPSRKQT